MSGEESGGEKSHEPTQKRLETARSKGDIAKSADVAQAASWAALLLVFSALASVPLLRSADVLRAILDRSNTLAGQVFAPGGLAVTGDILLAAGAPLAILLLAPLAAVVLALAGQRAIVFSPAKLAPKWHRISPMAALGNRFGADGLADFARSLAKLVIFALVTFRLLANRLDQIVGSVRAGAADIAGLLGELVVALLVAVTLVSVMIAALDYLWQRASHARRLRMSFQELKEESRESEGDPHIKGQRRQRAVEIATNRMLLDVPKADVVIVNPTHFAVALQWSRAKGASPVCVAKGTDAVAALIRTAAASAGVPLHQDALTARSIHALVAVGQEIRPEHFRPVAAAIQFSERLRKAARARNGG